MHYTQNDKIRQATEGTIVVGVDIGSEKNYLRAFEPNGIEITKKAISFLNTLEGFKSFEEIVTNMTVPLAGKKIIVGVEPTGHYWFNFADYCQSTPVQGKRTWPARLERKPAANTTEHGTSGFRICLRKSTTRQRKSTDETNC